MRIQKTTISTKNSFLTVKRIPTSQSWITVGDNRFYSRSLWERNYARYLDWMKKNSLIYYWEYNTEPFYFPGIKRGVTNYTPDFKICVNGPDKNVTYSEVKGYMDSKSITKIKRFRKYYPQYPLNVIDKTWFKENNNKFFNLIEGWE
jgi:hypothetical protein